ncbi:3-methyl-2-oxobutanoate hydroxymethyltransferase [Treponema sp.]|uniref:3-methyl-2-oxobutanoate hydroxymethyltransferase n=1 Tax=Treponema sp. TaxID=166 RepID=UPI00298DC28D|nr:3-methyl-2-oxobutanoate hydroxymethyltransferase [Treponema sp.]MCR5613287.1 3-methyl-2-oxobutanoate hydroxymethyltransferase [Treponema sp.]
MTLLDFPKRKNSNQKISMVTCYDASFARLVNESAVDCILIGDSCAMVMHGEHTTLPATIEMMALHTKAVRNGTDKFIVSDMPFLSTRKGLEYATDCAGKLLVAGANAVKIEGVDGQEDVIEHLVKSGIPVMSHLGLTPQFYNAFGGHKKQGKTEDSVEKIKREAKAAQELGCFSIVLECIPAELAREITNSVSIATIGIGAGLDCDGQVLVLQDLLGMSDFTPKFVHHFMDGKKLITDALNEYAKEVSGGIFPHKENY